MPSLAWLLFSAVVFAGTALADTPWSAYIQAFQRCKDDVVQHWSYEPDIVCATASVYGTQQKSANVSEVKNIFARGSSIDSARPEIAAGLPIFDSVQLYVSDRFKFIFIRHTRASSSSVLATIQELVCDAKVCLSHEFSTRSPDQIPDHIWTEYFVFTAVRNPLVRMISTFAMLSRHLTYREGPAAAPGDRCQDAVQFSEFAESVLVMRTACDTRQCCCYSPQGVDRFVVDMPQPYITQQAHAVFTPDGRTLVDYIARAENLSDDWDEIVWLISQRIGRELPRRSLLRISPSTATTHLPSPSELDAGQARILEPPPPRCMDERFARLGYLNATTAFGLAQQFAMDMQLLGFLRS